MPALPPEEIDRTILRMRADKQGPQAIGAAVGLSRHAVRRRLQKLAPRDSGGPLVTESQVGGGVSIESPSSSRITTLEQLLATAAVDLTVWEVERYVVNKWEVGAKDASDTVQTHPLFQVKAWLKRRVSEGAVAFRAQLLADIRHETGARERPALVRPATPSSLAERHMLEMCLFDLHIGKLAWAPETGAHYDSAIAERLARYAVADLLAQAAPYHLTKILLPLGNDFFHYDNLQGTTTAGTPQDRDTRYYKMFRRGRALASWMISECAKQAPVEVVIVGGNHDEQSDFHLGEVLHAEFANDSRVSFDTSLQLRKRVRFGKCLIGYAHGNETKPAELPQLMAVEWKQEWAETEFREYHIGHFHHGKAFPPVIVDDKLGVTVRFLRSLSGADQWHYRKGYVGAPRAAEAFVWNFERGQRAHLVSAALRDDVAAA